MNELCEFVEDGLLWYGDLDAMSVELCDWLNEDPDLFEARGHNFIDCECEACVKIQETRKALKDKFGIIIASTRN